MLSHFEIERKPLLARNSASFLNTIQILNNKRQIIYINNRCNMAVINISNGKLSSVFKEHKHMIDQISILQNENHSASIILSCDQAGFFKFWSITKKKCLRTLKIYPYGNCFAIFGSKIIIYRNSIGLGVFNFNGKQVEIIKTPDEMVICYHMIIHRNSTKNLLIYSGIDYIIIRNFDGNFEMISKIHKVGISFYTLTTFYNKHIQRLELITSDNKDIVYNFEMENFEETRNFIKNSLKCQTNIVYWRNFIILGYFDITFYEIKKEGMYPFFDIECHQELMTINVIEENEGTHLNLIVSSANSDVRLYRIKFC